MIVGDIEPILASIDSGDVSEVSILLQYFEWESPDGKEGLVPLQEVIAATDEDSHPAYVYVCKNGLRFVDSTVPQSEEELALGHRVYLDED